MNSVDQISALLESHAQGSQKTAIYFKTGAGDYAQHDTFIGVKVPILRTIAKQYATLSLQEIETLLSSAINEERLLALIILNNRYLKADTHLKEDIYQFYLKNIKYVNNWNLVDSSAYQIMGAHLIDKDKKKLLELAHSNNLWERRVAIVATYYFIKKNDLDWTFKIANVLLNDSHDLIHKSVGWMLREAGKRNKEQLMKFLDMHARSMPRTMLRYSLEKFSQDEKNRYV